MESNIITPLQSIELASLNGYLSALEQVLTGVNYSTCFEAKAFNISGEDLPINELMHVAYLYSMPSQAKIEKCGIEIMRKTIHDCFIDSRASGISAGKVEDLSRGFFFQLDNCIDLYDAIIYDYNSGLGLGDTMIFWSFAWIIYNQEQKRCVIFYGYSVD